MRTYSQTVAPYRPRLDDAVRGNTTLSFTQFVEDLYIAITEERKLENGRYNIGGRVFASYQGQRDGPKRCQFCGKVLRHHAHDLEGITEDEAENAEDWKTCPSVANTVVPGKISGFEVFGKTRRHVIQWLTTPGRREQVERFWKMDIEGRIKGVKERKSRNDNIEA